jgi:hypothetical protein
MAPKKEAVALRGKIAKLEAASSSLKAQLAGATGNGRTDKANVDALQDAIGSLAKQVESLGGQVDQLAQQAKKEEAGFTKKIEDALHNTERIFLGVCLASSMLLEGGTILAHEYATFRNAVSAVRGGEQQKQKSGTQGQPEREKPVWEKKGQTEPTPKLLLTTEDQTDLFVTARDAPKDTVPSVPPVLLTNDFFGFMAERYLSGEGSYTLIHPFPLPPGKIGEPNSVQYFLGELRTSLEQKSASDQKPQPRHLDIPRREEDDA